MGLNRFPKNPYYVSLTRNMILMVLIMSFAPMILGTFIVMNRFDSSYQEKVNAHLKELVNKHKQNIDVFLNAKLNDIRFVSEVISFNDLNNETLLRGALNKLRESFQPVFVDIGLVNGQGRQTAYVGPFKLMDADYAEADWFKKAMKTPYSISDVFLGLRGSPHFIVAVRKIYEGKPWILRATIDFVTFNDLVENIRIGETGFAYILNRSGELQTKSPLGSVNTGDGVFAELLRGESARHNVASIVRHTDASGTEYIYVSSFLKNGDWLLVFQQKTSDAFAILNRIRRTALLIFVIGAFGIVTAAYFLSIRMVNRIAKADREKEMMNQQVIETGKLASIGELAAGIAHEINNPVAIMVEEAGWIDDLLKEEEFGPSENLDEFRRALKQIATQGKRCKDITHKLLSFARKTDSKVQDVNLNDILSEIVELTRQRARYSNVKIVTRLQAGLPPVKTSPTEMQQIFLNMLNNAIDAMEKKGGEIKISTWTEGILVRVDIEDNGPGIPAANLARIFDPFFTTKPVGKGTGLGLSICYGIVKKLGGEIKVKSVVDLGTTFTIYLPFRDESAPKDKQA